MAHVKMSLFFKSDSFIWKISGWSELFDDHPFYYETGSYITVKQVLKSTWSNLFIFKFLLGS